MKAQRLERRRHERAQQGIDHIHDPQRVFELLHSLGRQRSARQVRGDESFMRRRTASIATAATTEDAPASSPNGGRRKRAIITYARKASKAYRQPLCTVQHGSTARDRGFESSLTDDRQRPA